MVVQEAPGPSRICLGLSDVSETPWEAAATRSWRTPVLVVGLFVVVGSVAMVLRSDRQLPGDPVPIIEASDRNETSEPSAPEVTAPAEPIGQWMPMSEAPFEPRQPSPGVWSGEELVVWDHSDTRLVWAYDPSTDTWRSGTAAAPQDRSAGDYGVIFAGGMLVIAGGSDPDGLPTAQAMAYDVAADAWTELPEMPLTGRTHPGMAADQNTVVVWGGQPLATPLPGDVGARLDLTTNRWERLDDMDLDSRSAPAVGLTTTADIGVWGGTAGNVWITDGALLGADGTVTAIPPPPVNYDSPPAAAWMDTRLVVWGRPGANLRDRPGYIWEAQAGWRPLPRLLRQERGDPDMAVDQDRRQITVWGGIERFGLDRTTDGFVLDLTTEQWRRIPPAPLTARHDATVILAEGQVIVWGGASGGVVPHDGVRYRLEPR